MALAQIQNSAAAAMISQHLRLGPSGREPDREIANSPDDYLLNNAATTGQPQPSTLGPSGYVPGNVITNAADDYLLNNAATTGQPQPSTLGPSGREPRNEIANGPEDYSLSSANLAFDFHTARVLRPVLQLVPHGIPWVPVAAGQPLPAIPTTRDPVRRLRAWDELEIELSARSLLTPVVAHAVERLLSLLQRHSQLHDIPVTRVNLWGFTDPEDDSHEIVITLWTNLPMQRALKYWDRLGPAIQAWVNLLPSELAEVITTDVSVDIEWSRHD